MEIPEHLHPSHENNDGTNMPQDPRTADSGMPDTSS